MLVKLSTIRRFYFGLARTMTSAQTLTLQVNADDAGNRLDRWLAEAADGLSRSRVQALIQDGKLQGPGGDVVSDASRKVRDGETFVLHIPAPTPARPQAEDIPLEVLHEDSDLIVINKPPGLVVHPAPGHYTGTLVNALLHHCRGSLSGIGGVTRPGIVHRLDKDTAGDWSTSFRCTVSSVRIKLSSGGCRSRPKAGSKIVLDGILEIENAWLWSMVAGKRQSPIIK